MASYIQENKRSWRTVVSALLFAFAFFYLGYHALSGDRGFYALLKEERKRDSLKLELSELHSERAELEQKISGLGSSSLDIDLLDERARVVLGYAGIDEMLISLPE